MWALENRDAAQGRVMAGQEYIRKKFSSETIADAWKHVRELTMKMNRPCRTFSSHPFKETLMETLINCLCGMKRKAHGAQEPRHIQKYVEVTNTALRSDSPTQAINPDISAICRNRGITGNRPEYHLQIIFREKGVAPK